MVWNAVDNSAILRCNPIKSSRWSINLRSFIIGQEVGLSPAAWQQHRILRTSRTLLAVADERRQSLGWLHWPARPRSASRPTAPSRAVRRCRNRILPEAKHEPRRSRARSMTSRREPCGATATAAGAFAAPAITGASAGAAAPGSRTSWRGVGATIPTAIIAQPRLPVEDCERGSSRSRRPRISRLPSAASRFGWSTPMDRARRERLAWTTSRAGAAA